MASVYAVHRQKMRDDTESERDKISFDINIQDFFLKYACSQKSIKNQKLFHAPALLCKFKR